MAKLTLTDLNNLSSESSAIATINANSAAIELALENTLSRDGTIPNTMDADIDLNGNTLLNIDGLDMNNSKITGLADPTEDTDAVPLSFVGNAPAILEQAQDAADAASADAASTAADVITTNADVVLTHADVVLTHADVVLTHADVVLTHADASDTAADALATAADRVQTGLDRAQTTSDAADTAADAIATAADRVQTGQDVTDAQAALAATLVAADNFDDVYLGSKASDPTLDNDGNALVEGQLYWNSATNALKVYDGSVWQSYSAASGITAVADDTAPTLGGNLDLNTFDITGTGDINITGGATFTADVVVPDEAYDATGWNGSTEVPTKNAVRDTIETVLGTTLPATYQPLDSDLTSWAGVTRASGFDTFVATPSSANLATLLTDESGSSTVAFTNAPTLTNPVVGTQSARDNSTKAASTAYVDTADKIMPRLQNVSSGFTLALADAGGLVRFSGGSGQTLTIPANGTTAFPIGTVITILNKSGNNWTIAITTDTLSWSPAGTTGSRTLANHGLCTLIKGDTTAWAISGVGLT